MLTLEVTGGNCPSLLVGCHLVMLLVTVRPVPERTTTPLAHSSLKSTVRRAPRGGAAALAASAAARRSTPVFQRTPPRTERRGRPPGRGRCAAVPAVVSRPASPLLCGARPASSFASATASSRSSASGVSTAARSMNAAAAAASSGPWAAFARCHGDALSPTWEPVPCPGAAPWRSREGKGGGGRRTARLLRRGRATRWNRSATWTAVGAPTLAPSAKNGARDRRPRSPGAGSARPRACPPRDPAAGPPVCGSRRRPVRSRTHAPCAWRPLKTVPHQIGRTPWAKSYSASEEPMSSLPSPRSFPAWASRERRRW